MIKITDNFLNKDNFQMLQDWYFKQCTWKTFDIVNGEGLQFVHEHHPVKFFNTLKMLGLTELLNISNILRAKCNITFRKNSQEILENEWHTDFPNFTDDTIQTSILYINSNNGGTAFKTGEFIKSKSNRLVAFPLSEVHAGVHTTDADFRCVLNVNYKKNK